MRFALPFALSVAALSSGALFAQAETAKAEAPSPVPTASEARALAEEFARKLEDNFVFPETGKRYAAALRVKAAAGGYDKTISREALAEMMTADVQAIAPDGHLRVFASPPDLSRPAVQPGSTPPSAVEKARWVAPGVAFIRFNGFPGSEESVAASRQFVRDYATAKTLIIDVRTHRGGGLDEMDVMFPLLFAQSTQLVAMETRAAVVAAGNEPLDDRATLKRVASAPEVVRQDHWALAASPASPLASAKIYVLTSGGSASAAEHFALTMKRTHRATLIGQPTAGAGHYGGMVPLPSGFTAFIPVGRTYDPDTGQGWEGPGVAPDVEVPAEQALVEALKRAGIASADAERLSAELAPQGRMHRRVRAASR
ncbi:S41 family peptidase [Sphingomonas cavernae]|nr:S41 family peptidase [Sphingomonas cavernae]